MGSFDFGGVSYKRLDTLDRAGGGGWVGGLIVVVPRRFDDDVFPNLFLIWSTVHVGGISYTRKISVRLFSEEMMFGILRILSTCTTFEMKIEIKIRYELVSATALSTLEIVYRPSHIRHVQFAPHEGLDVWETSWKL